MKSRGAVSPRRISQGGGSEPVVPRKARWFIGMAAVGTLAVMSAMGYRSVAEASAQAYGQPSYGSTSARIQNAAPLSPDDPRANPPQALVSTIRALGAGFRGKVGIAVMRADGEWVAAWNGASLFPQQSVSKLWVAMTALDAVDRGKLSLDTPITIRPQDLTLFHQPIAAQVKGGSYTTTVMDLLTRAMTQSDNTANDSLLRAAGGPDAVRAFLARRFIRDIRFGPGERLLQATTAGLEWRQDYSVGRNFYTARSALPMTVRNRALDDYLASPPDGAAPASIVLALAKLTRGEMLSPGSTRLLLSVMEGAKTGPQRIKGGVPAAWTYAHKTGTGQELAPRSTGFNDVGIMTAPDGTRYAVAVMIGETTLPIPSRWDLMQSVSRAIAANHPAGYNRGY